MSKISIRRQSFWSVTSAMERNLSLTFFPQLFFLLSPLAFQWTLRTPWGRIWMGMAKEKALLINSEPRGAQPRQTRLPRGPPAPGGRRKPFSHQSPVFLFQGLTVAPFFYMLVKKQESTGATDTARFQCVAQPRWWQPGQAAQLRVWSQHTRDMFSCPLGVECQNNRPNPSKVALPHFKYPALLTLSGSCGVL